MKCELLCPSEIALVLRYRLLLNLEGLAEGVRTDQVVRELRTLMA